MGFLVGRGGVRHDPGSIAALRDAPRPTTVAGVRRIVGMINFYRKHIAGAARLLEPLYELLRGRSGSSKAAVSWGEREEEAWCAAVDALARAAPLAFIDWAAPLTLRTDFSATAIGAVLEQHGVPIAFFSSTLSPAQRRYPAIKGEAWAIVAAVRHWRALLQGARVIIETDHRPLVYVLDGARQSSLLARWFLELLDLRFDVRYVRGPANVVADALSRLWEAQSNASDDVWALAVDAGAPSAVDDVDLVCAPRVELWCALRARCRWLCWQRRV